MSAIRREEIDRLPTEERLRLVEDIWESIRSHPESIPLTEAQREELDHRLTAHEVEPDAASGLDAAISRVRHRR